MKNTTLKTAVVEFLKGVEGQLDITNNYSENRGYYTEVERLITDTWSELTQVSTRWDCTKAKDGVELEWSSINVLFDSLIDAKQGIAKMLKTQIVENTASLNNFDAPIRIWVVDLAEYNAGNICGQWVALPQDEETLDMVVDKYSNFGNGDIVVHDAECSFMKIGEYDNIYNLNEIAKEVVEFNEDDFEIIGQIFENNGWNIIDAVETYNNRDFAIYYNCCNMAEVAEQYADETGLLNEIPDNLKSYFDFEAYGRDMELNGNFVYLGNGTYLELF